MIKKRVYASLCVLLLLFSAAAPAAFYSSLPVCALTVPVLRSYTQTLNCSGTVTASEIAVVRTAVPICVEKLYVQNGSYVVRGQKLLDVDRQKLLALAAAGSSDDFSQLDPADLEKAVAAAASLDKGAASALSQIPEAIYASNDGYIESFNLEEGAFVAANTGICTVTSGSAHRLKLTVPEDRLGDIPVGSAVRFRPVAYDDREYYAVVEDTPANIRRQLTTTGYRSVADIYATVEAADEYLENGLTVTSTVLIADRQQLMTIPYKAIDQDEKGEYVYRIENGRAVKSYIVTGLELEDTVEVQSGLDLGASIVEDCSAVRSAGQLVRLKGEKAA